MKLKKIASLALAGIMAVSMLAGCSTPSVDPEPTPNPGDDEPAVSGYSQMLYNPLATPSLAATMITLMAILMLSITATGWTQQIL